MTGRYTVEHEPDQSRYVLVDREAGASQPEEIGEESYVDVEGERVLYHTVVSDEYAGQGLASLLVREVVEDTIASGLRIVPVCPYVAAWLPKHPEYAEHVAERRAEHGAAVRARVG
ncbi:GNAT family N-acetyltransferase [Microbacterium sp.]|uniref:GNAT family N-acetyltransferase n=1 Tax=Microbacterium sp. TaxID=51671 RepID=UPI002811EFD5|nr:GNAT family N-acetyltransferase [Microbacterium sp.]